MNHEWNETVFVHINHSGKANEGEHVLGRLKCDAKKKKVCMFQHMLQI